MVRTTVTEGDSHTARRTRVDITIKGRHTEVADRFREHALEKLAKLERYDHKAGRLDVEVCEERNPGSPTSARGSS